MIDLNDIAPAFVLDLNEVAPPPGRYDLEELSRRLSEQAGSWVPQLFPNGRPEGGELRLANIKGKRPRKTGSCVIPLTGTYAGCFHDFDTGESGGPLKTPPAPPPAFTAPSSPPTVQARLRWRSRR